MLFAKRFEGRRAVVTGGAAGIGLAVATRIAAEGGLVALWDRDRAAIDAAVGRIGASAYGRRRRHRVPGRRSRPRPREDVGAHRRRRYAGLLGRDHRPQCQDLGLCARGLAPCDGGQSRRAVLLQQGARAGHADVGLRPHRQHRLDRRQGGATRTHPSLFDLEGRRDRADEVARQGTRRQWRSRSIA